MSFEIQLRVIISNLVEKLSYAPFFRSVTPFWRSAPSLISSWTPLRPNFEIAQIRQFPRGFLSKGNIFFILHFLIHCAIR